MIVEVSARVKVEADLELEEEREIS